MDNSFIKQMMKAQGGMDMSDEQISQMKNMMTPEMLASVSKMDPSTLKNMKGGFGGGAGSTGGSGTTAQAGAGQPNMAGMPDMSQGMPNINSDMVKNMMGMLKQNPEMLRNMSGMLGENHPLSKFIQNKSPEELKKYIGWMEKASGVVGFFAPVWNFLRKYYQLILGALIGYLIYKFL